MGEREYTRMEQEENSRSVLRFENEEEHKEYYYMIMPHIIYTNQKNNN